MKWNLIIVVLLLLLGLAGMMAFNTIIGDQQRVIEAQQVETDRVTAELYWTRIAALPPAWCQPLEQLWISSGTGYRMDPMGGGTEDLHKGVDLAGAIGTPIKAVLSGRVVEHYLTPGIHYGKMYYGDPYLGAKIVLDHGNNLYSIYGHLSDTEVHEGEWIEMGDKIGELGNTGISTGSHLHFEIVVDPLRYLEER